jgi:hypothetical protein
MAIKFSQFITQTSASSLSHIVGYNGADNIQITPADFFTSFAVGSAGQVSFFDTTSSLAGSNDFSWDYTNNRLGIGTINPNRTLHIATDSGVLIKGASGSVNAKISLLPASGGRQYDLGNVGSDFRIFDASAGVTRMYFDNDGNTGVGTTTPSSTLQVSGTLDATGISQLGSGGSNVYLTSSSAGNVGIGTSSPSDKLTVSGNLSIFGNKIYNGSAANSAGVSFPSSTTRIDGYNGITFHSSTATVGSQSERMRITSTGNVGIGTTSPESKLTIKGNPGNTNQPVRITNVSTDAKTGLFINGTGNAVNEKYGMQFGGYNEYSIGGIFGVLDSTGGSTSGDITFDFGNGTAAGDLIEKVRFTHEGNVGIGTSSPSAKLQIESTSGNALSFTHSGQETYNISHGTSGLYLKLGSTILTGWTQNHDFTIWDSSGNNYVMFDGSTQRVGIGTTSPDEKLHILDTTGANIILNSDTVASNSGVYMSEGGNATPTQNGAYMYYDATGNNFKIATGSTSLTDRLTIARDTGDATFAGAITVQSGNKLILNRPNNAIDCELSTDSSGTLILNSRNSEGFKFQNSGTNFVTGDSSNNVTFAGDVEVTDSTNGLILKSPDGTRYRVTVANGGTLSVSAV